MVAFYNAKDQAIYDAGDKFVPQTEYLQNDYVPTEGISYEGDGSPVSYAKSGIMTQAPIIYPPINQGGGGGGGGDDDDDDENKTYDGPSMSPIDAAKQAGLFFLNPIGYLASKAFGAYRKHGQRKKADNITNQASGLTDRGNITNVQDYTGKKLSDYRMSRPASERNFTGHGKSGMGRNPEDKMAKGGRVGYFFGGRAGYKDGYSVQDDMEDFAQNVGKEAAPGGGFVGGDNDGGSTKPTFYGKNDNIITTDFISKNPNLTINYADPKNFASLKSKIGFNNILDNDDINVDGTLSGEIGPVSYNTNFTDQGITGTNLKAGNFNANLNPDMQIQNIGYNNNYKGIDYGVNTNFDNTMFTAGVNFKNGGIAGLL